jgi:hypothetical protein
VQRQVERRALEGPPAVVAVHGERELVPEERVDLVEVTGEAVERPGARQRQDGAPLLLAALQLGVVDHVLAGALRAVASQGDGGRAALELAELAGAALEGVVLDAKLELRDAFVGAHATKESKPGSTASRGASPPWITVGCRSASLQRGPP